MTTNLDERLRDFLADEGRRVTSGAPSLDEAVGRLAPRLAPAGHRSPRRFVILAAAALLTAAAAASAIGIGSGLVRLPLVIDTPSVPTEREAVFEVALHYYTSRDGLSGVLERVSEPARIHARLPDGWVSTDSGMRNDLDEPEHAVTISFWAVEGVSLVPCGGDGGGADPPMMRTLDGLAEAFTIWWQGNVPSEMWVVDGPPPGQPGTTAPASTTVSGFRARYIEVRFPDSVDTNECPGGRYATWRNADGVVRRHAPGEVSRIWIVEVGPPRGGGGRVPETSTPLLVVDAASRGQPSPDALTELAGIIDSLRIEAPPAMTPDPSGRYDSNAAVPLETIITEDLGLSGLKRLDPDEFLGRRSAEIVMAGGPLDDVEAWAGPVGENWLTVARVAGTDGPDLRAAILEVGGGPLAETVAGKDVVSEEGGDRRVYSYFLDDVWIIVLGERSSAIQVLSQLP